MIEPLEFRIAPASLSFVDVDGDHVVITTSGAGTLVSGVNVLFDASGHQLQTLDLRNAAFENANVSIVATRGTSGDGLVNVGYVNATGRDLGTVSVDGDLGAIDAGNSLNAAVACKALSVGSLGRFGTGTGAPDLVSDFVGQLGKLSVKTDTTNAKVNADGIGAITVGGSVRGDITSTGDIGAVTVGVDNFNTIASSGKIASVVAGGNDGTFRSSGDLGPVKISGYSFRVESTNGKLASVTIGGTSNALQSGGDMGPVKIGGSLFGQILCGGALALLQVGGLSTSAVTVSGNIGPVKVGGDDFTILQSTNGKIASVTVGGSLFGHLGSKTGIGLVRIAQDLSNSVGSFGSISTDGALAGVVVGGSVVGGTSASGGSISSKGDMGLIQIHGSLLGSTANETGKIDCGGKLAGVTIDGSIQGGTGHENTFNDGTLTHEGQIFAVGQMGPVKIGYDLAGNTGIATGEIRSHTKLTSVVIGGSISGFGQASGQVASDGSIGSVRVGGDVSGDAANAGRIGTGGAGPGGNIGSIFIGGSLLGGFDASGDNAGIIFSTGDIGSITIKGNFRGGVITNSSTADHSGWGYIEASHIGSIVIGGSIQAATNGSSTHALTKSGSIRARDDIGSLTVKGSIMGTQFDSVIVSARGAAHPTATKDVAFGKISVRGRIENALILAGYGPNGVASNADAQVGTVSVAGDWIATSLVAGVTGGTNAVVGDSDDAKVANTGQAGFKDGSDALGAVSKIAKVIIGGSAIGTTLGTDNKLFGIEAQQIVSIQLGGAIVPFTPGAGNDLFAQRQVLSPTHGTSDVDGFDFHAFEVPAI